MATRLKCKYVRVTQLVAYAFTCVFRKYGENSRNMSSLNPRVSHGFALVPEADEYMLANCSVPTVLLSHPRIQDLPTDSDSLARCDIVVADGSIKEVYAPGKVDLQCPVVDVEGGCVFPTFVDLHTHIGASMRVLYVVAALSFSLTSRLQHYTGMQ